jgi:4-diphosphocytidyl-2-C-methyl-D-erythritol kinase
LIVFPNCKINLGLRIKGKRADGYHDLDTVFLPLSMCDVAELLVAPDGQNAEPFELHSSGTPIESSPEGNLCYKAWKLLKTDFPGMPAMTMYLHKAIPSGAGLGGGSSDAAFTLKLVNEAAVLGLSSLQLHDYALKLGSDCPFFLSNKPSYATGRGEQLQALDLAFDRYTIILIHPHIHISTGWAFRELASMNIDQEVSLSGMDASSLPIEDWKNHIFNEFEPPVFSAYPQIGRIKELLYQSGALFASMTGTGSCVYGIFDQARTPSKINIEKSYTVYYLKILS